MKYSDEAGDATSLYQPNDLIALRMGRLAATRVNAESLSHFRDDLDRLHARGGGPYVRLWSAAINTGPEAVRQLLVEPSQRGQVMRSLISFRAFVSKVERDVIFSEVAAAVTAAWKRV